MIIALILALLVSAQPQTPAAGVPRLGTVTGKISSSSGAPAAGTRIGLMEADDVNGDVTVMGIAQTGSDGRYRLDGVTPGRYYLFAGSLDFPTYYPGTTELSSATVITVGAGATIDQGNFALARVTEGFKVSGRVVSHVASPIKLQGIAMLMRMELGNVAGTATFSDDGAFVISGVPPGVYVLNVGLTEQGPRSRISRPPFNEFSRAEAAVEPVILSVKRDITGIEVVIPRLVEVPGIVTSEDGRALPSFSVRFVRGDFQGDMEPAELEADGIFEQVLPEGEYRVHAAGLPQGYYFKTLTAGSTDLLRSPLKLGATDTRVRIAGVLARSSPVRVNGRLAGSAATARPATIALIDLGGSQTSAKINPDGTFSIPRVIPGTYTVSLAHKSGLEVFSGHATVSEKDVNEIEIAAPRLREVTGRVAWKGEGPAPAFTLIAASGVAGELKDLVDLGNEMFLPMLLKPAGDAQPLIAAMSIDPLPDGTFHFVLPEGEYQAVVVFGNASGDTPPGKPLGRSTFQLSSLTYGATDLLSKPMNVGRGSAELLVSMTGRPVPSFNIAGRLAGLPPGSQRDARIELVTENEQVLLQITVGADGAFEFVKVPPGKYVARIASSKLAAPAIPVRVANSDVEITLTIPPQQEIKGRMVIDDTPGAAPPRMRIELMGSKGPLGVTLEPERDGTFRIAVPEGDYAVVGILPPSDFIPAAITYGNTSLDGGSLLAVRRANPDLVVRLTAVPTVAMGASRRVSGTFSGSGSGIVLQGMAARAKHEAPIANGKFEIPDVPPGVYMILTAANGQTTHTEPAYVAVPAKGQGPIELQLSPGSGREATVEEQPTGVTAIRMISRRAPQSPFEFLVSSAAPALGKANEAAAVANLRTVNTAQVTYLSTTGGNYGGLPDMVQAGLLDTRFNGAVSGYLYFVIAESGDYVAVAAPVNPGSGQRAFFSTPDGVVRFSAAPQLAPPGLESQPVQ